MTTDVRSPAQPPGVRHRTSPGIAARWRNRRRQVTAAVPVVLLKLSSHPFHQGTIGIARKLGRLGVPVYSFQDSRWDPLVFSSFSRGYLVQDLGALPAEAAVDYLLAVADWLGRTAILIPVDDAGCIFAADNAAVLRERFLFPEPPPGLVRRLSSKRELYFLCKERGIPTPETTFPQSRQDVLTFLETATFPVALKVDDPAQMKGRASSKRVAIVRTPKQLLANYDEMEQPGRPNVMLQEYIPGGTDTVWMFNGYFNRDSDCLIGITGKKLRQFLPYTGATSLGICIENETVEETTGAFMKAVGYRGILDIGYRYDARDGQYKVLDVNPRIGATFRLFEDTAGLDVAQALYLDLTGQQVRPGQPRVGRKWIVENYDLLSSLRYTWDGQLTPREWLRSLRGIEESAWFARDDLLPFVVMCLTFVPRSALSYVRSKTAVASHSGSS